MDSYKQLIVWQKAVELSVRIYKITEGFPKAEIYGITSQIRRSAVSIPSNIAEGQNRKHTSEFIHFLHISLGSTAELETQIEISKQLGYIKKEDCLEISSKITEILKMLNTLITKLDQKLSTNH